MSLGVVYIIGGIVSVLLYFCALGVLIFMDEDYFGHEVIFVVLSDT